MLIELLLNLADYIITPLLNIIGTILEITNINVILDPIKEGFDMIFSAASSLIWLCFDMQFLRIILGMVLTIEISFSLYRITMWALKKIPKMNISE